MIFRHVRYTIFDPHFFENLQILSKIIHGMLNRVHRHTQGPQEIIKIVFTLPGITPLRIIKKCVFFKGNIQGALECSVFVLETSSFGIIWFKGLLIW